MTESGNAVPQRSTFGYGTPSRLVTESHTFTLTNDSTDPINLQSVTVPDGFTLTSSPISNHTLAGGESLDIDVQLDPILGQSAGELEIVVEDEGLATHRFTISGTVVAEGRQITVNAFGDEGDEQFVLSAGTFSFPPATVSTTRQSYDCLLYTSPSPRD